MCPEPLIMLVNWIETVKGARSQVHIVKVLPEVAVCYDQMSDKRSHTREG